MSVLFNTGTGMFSPAVSYAADAGPTSGGWITGRFEWDSGAGGVPTFYFSVELDGGGVAQLHFSIPERALLRWA